MKKFLKGIIFLLLIIILLIGGYVAYMHFTYYRIDDNVDLTNSIHNNQNEILKVDEEYIVLSQNFGFGAYTRDFSFFMDSGEMEDGTSVSGSESRAKNKEVVLENIDKLIDVLRENDPDFICLQEVDIDSTRAHHVNQVEKIRESFHSHSSVFDMNLHSPYLFYPITEPHGSVTSGLLSLSKYRMDSAVHRKLFINEAFFARFIDLDRCFTLIRIPVEGDRELVLINLHLSAYDEGGKSRQEQLKTLNEVMEKEYSEGHYVILAGDFNHILNDSYQAIENKQKKPDWVFDFPEEDLPQHFSIVEYENGDELGTCRTTDIPYEKGVNYEERIDGFIVSDNMEVSSEIIDTGYGYSDHNPVKLRFKLEN